MIPTDKVESADLDPRHSSPLESGRIRFVFFSQLLGKSVFSAEGHALGRLADLIVIPGEPYPPVDALVVRSWRSARLRLLWTSVASFDERGIRLIANAVAEPLPTQCPSDRLRLAEEILDRQIVDVEGAKLERVNDLHFLEVKGILRLAHVDVGFRGLVRRMGWEGLIDGTLTRLNPGSGYLKGDSLLSWKLVQPLGPVSGRVRLDVAQRQLATLHPADLAEIMEELDRYQRANLFRRLDLETAAEALQESSPEVSRELIEQVAPERAADILEEMAPDEAADVLGDLPQETRSELLEAMDRPEAKEVQDLLRYDPRSAGGLMTPDFIRLGEGHTAGDALAEVRLHADEFEPLYEIFVVDAQGFLKGECTLKDLVVADPSQLLASLMREAPGTVGAEASVDEVADLAAKYNLLSVPVVESTGELLGVVTVDDILPEVLRGR